MMFSLKSPFAIHIDPSLSIFTQIYNKLLNKLLLWMSQWIKHISLIVNSSIDFPHNIFNMYPWPDEVDEDQLEWFISTFLSKENGADFNKTDFLGLSPIYRAIYLGNIEK